ncbi:unannotated protein [freshwater metagenome]|uniref:Unannotated protein n=1 Tax=freshwater metagenome TaxID=449393 RepID=A0A6J7DYX3_9ZZZZ|nr:DNA recombination protein RmuC [Actinomycetota bacterium]
MGIVAIIIVGLIAICAGIAIGYLLGRNSSATELSKARSEVAVATARLTDAQTNQDQAKTQFVALAADALKANTESFLDFAEERLKRTEQTNATELDKQQKAVENLMKPIKESLDKVGTELHDLELKRVEAYTELKEQVSSVQTNSEGLKKETASLVQALRAPQTRGQWGELQLKRLMEIAGMTEGHNYKLQQNTVSADGRSLRPDMIVYLQGGRNVVVDSKVVLTAILEANESSDADVIESKLRDHAKNLRKHVENLTSKQYEKEVDGTPEFVILFLATEAFLAPALERDKDLLEDAFNKGVIIATPTTLISMLKSINFASQQEKLSENAKEIQKHGKDLYNSLIALSGHIAKLGRSINTVVGDFNKTVGSVEKNVFSKANKLKELGAGGGELEQPLVVDDSAKLFSNSELGELPDEPTQIRLVD